MKNIIERSSGYRVKIQRERLTYRAYVPYGHDRAAALRQAVALRDEFYAVHGQYGPSGQAPRSNTGITGICETTKWYGGKPYSCFEVCHGRHTYRRFVFKTLSEREAAMASAIALRQEWEASHV